MRFDFLAAADNTPLTKTYTKTAAGQTVEPYPFIAKFTSYTENADSAEALLPILRRRAAQNQCLLKGTLYTELNNESRAGQTNSTLPTNYVLLDIDTDRGFESIDAFLEALQPGLSEVDYIFQHSSSAGITGKPGLRGHLWFLLEDSLVPQQLKLWLMHKNLTIEALRAQLRLSANGMALRYALDRTTCQNDKLIYIAPPICTNFDDPLTNDRFTLHRGKNASATLDLHGITAEQVKQLEADVLAELRKAAGLPKRSAKYSYTKQGEILTNPDRATITGEREARGFTYVNLNGGDSWAYYYPSDNPELLYNFKGEPIVRLREIAPDYYASKLHAQRADEAPNIPFVFRDPIGDTYYAGLYNNELKELELLAPIRTKDRIKDFFLQYGIEAPAQIDDWTREFDPSTNEIIDFQKRWVNLFAPTKYMRDQTKIQAAPVPTTILKILKSICVDEPTLARFINWYAAIWQSRSKTGTAWIFQGTQGTGKGIFHNHITQPLFGAKHAHSVTIENLEDKFNEWRGQNIITFVDEANLNDSREGERISNKLKNLITEPTLMLRAMRQSPIEVKSYSNFIFATNQRNPIPLEETDRRFNVAPRQTNKLQITAAEITRIKHELHQFAAHLTTRQVNWEQAKAVLENGPRAALISANTNSVETFFRAIAEGNLNYFAEFVRAKTPASIDGLQYIDYERLIRQWAVSANKPSRVSRDDLETAYNYLQGKKTTPNKSTRMCHLHNIGIKQQRLGDKRIMCAEVTWHADPETLDELTKPDIRTFHAA